ncbi:unnamed protein product [Prorocentrum cordatum]|uniref:Uncharacterized protein n=1 Tax=Prorocentrum cordatum TaxID=2364126 RepID=A0ABN9VJB8_9DINO|nr:unnamed protein product [Polarella glacialis]
MSARGRTPPRAAAPPPAPRRPRASGAQAASLGAASQQALLAPAESGLARGSLAQGAASRAGRREQRGGCRERGPSEGERVAREEPRVGCRGGAGLLVSCAALAAVGASASWARAGAHRAAVRGAVLDRVSAVAEGPNASAVYVELVASVFCARAEAWAEVNWGQVDCANTAVYLYAGCTPHHFERQTAGLNGSWLSELPPCVHLEFLQLEVVQAMASPQLQATAQAGVTYLWHLKAAFGLAKTEAPPGALVFLPGMPTWADGPLDAVEYARRWAAAGVGFAPLSFASCEALGLDGRYSEQRRDLAHKLFGFLTGSKGAVNWVAGFENQFFVSFRRASGVPAWLYDYLLELLSNDGGRLAEAMERLWGPLFGCWAPFPYSLEDLRGAFPACRDGCGDGFDSGGARGLPGCGPNQVAAQRAASPPQGKREWVQAMTAPSARALPACTSGVRLVSEGYLARGEAAGWRCEALFREPGAPGGRGVCAIESLANLSEEAGGGGGGLPGAQENAGGDADLDGDLVPYFARVRSVEACPEQPDSQLGLSAISGSLRTCGTACLMYGECLGFSWRESALSCTLLRGACERSGNGAAQLYSKRSATPAPIEVVLSGYCDDDFTWVREVDCAAAVVFLYTKCDREDPLQNIPPGLPLCVRVELLSNIGREGGTFLHHLHAHQERFRSPSASGALVLLQGEVEWHAGQLDVLEYASQWASAGFGFAPLSFAGCSDRGPFVYGGCGWDCHHKACDADSEHVQLPDAAKPVEKLVDHRLQGADAGVQAAGGPRAALAAAVQPGAAGLRADRQVDVRPRPGAAVERALRLLGARGGQHHPGELPRVLGRLRRRRGVRPQPAGAVGGAAGPLGRAGVDRRDAGSGEHVATAHPAAVHDDVPPKRGLQAEVGPTRLQVWAAVSRLEHQRGARRLRSPLVELAGAPLPQCVVGAQSRGFEDKKRFRGSAPSRALLGVTPNTLQFQVCVAPPIRRARAPRSPAVEAPWRAPSG